MRPCPENQHSSHPVKPPNIIRTSIVHSCHSRTGRKTYWVNAQRRMPYTLCISVQSGARYLFYPSRSSSIKKIISVPVRKNPDKPIVVSVNHPGSSGCTAIPSIDREPGSHWSVLKRRRTQRQKRECRALQPGRRMRC